MSDTSDTADLARRLAAADQAAQELDSAAREPRLRELALVMHESAHAARSATTPPLERVGDVIEALAETAAAMCLASWGYPQPGSVGDNPLVVVVDGHERGVRAVRSELGRMIMELDSSG